MAVQVPRRLESFEHGVQGSDADVRLVVLVPEAQRGRVREQHVDRATPFRSSQESTRAPIKTNFGIRRWRLP